MAISDVITTIQNWIDVAKADLYAALGFAGEELPQLDAVIATVAAVLGTVFPSAAGVAAFLIAAEGAVAYAETLVKTLEGVLMPASEATNIGVAATAMFATGDEKNTVAMGMLKAQFGDVPDHVKQLAIEAHVSKLARNVA